MTDIETVGEAFIAFLEDIGVGTFNVDLYLNQVPDKAPKNCMWVITSGGGPEFTTVTGDKIKNYTFDINYRSTSGKKLERILFGLEEILNCTACVNLEGFDTLGVEASQFASDEDVDDESRRQGLLQANVRLFKARKYPVVS